MPGKRVKSSSGWTLVDENIENVKRLRLDFKTQRELGCVVGVDVFLEYPWAYVSRETILKLSKFSDSPFTLYEEILKSEENPFILIGYSSPELISDDFVICLTEEAQKKVEQRNKGITKKIKENVISRMIKNAKAWEPKGSEKELEETFVTNKRGFFEVEINVPTAILGSHCKFSDRNSGDVRDGYVELVSSREDFDIIEKKQITKTVQTHFGPRENCVQTYPGFPRNAWTQYDYEDISKDEQRECESSQDQEKRSTEEMAKKNQDKTKSSENGDAENFQEKESLKLFLRARSGDMIDAIKYNSVINVYVDDIETLKKQDDKEIKIVDKLHYQHHMSFIDLKNIEKKIISDLSWHPKLDGHLAVSYTISPPCPITKSYSSINIKAKKDISPKILLWSFEDSLHPKLSLEDSREIVSVSFCPSEEIIVGGSLCGHIIIWSIKDYPNNFTKIDNKNTKTKSFYPDIPKIPPLLVSDKNRSHNSAVRKIQWIPERYRIESNGKLTKLSTNSSLQFMTASEDGTVCVWDILWRPLNLSTALSKSVSLIQDLKTLNNIFCPIYRLTIQCPEEGCKLVPISLCLPSVNVLEEKVPQRGTTELNLRERDYLKKFWLGTAEGDLVSCTWNEQMFDAEMSDSKDCQFLSRTYIHDGPVTDIVRSPHLQDVLLTIGGHVFAIWKDDFLESPLFLKKSSSRYNTCCWTNKPGVLLIAKENGELEVWDIKRSFDEPVLVQSVSMQSVTGLYLQNSVKKYFSDQEPEEYNMIAVADYVGVLRMLKEPRDRFINYIDRMDWFEEYIWKEERSKKLYYSQYKDIPEKDLSGIVTRRAKKEQERARKQEEARRKLQMEHEERLKLEEKRRLRDIPQSKETIYKLRVEKSIKNILLKKKGFVPSELEKKRLPLVHIEAERKVKLFKAKNEAALHEKYFRDIVATKFPEIQLDQEGKNLSGKTENIEKIENTGKTENTEKTEKAEKSTEEYIQEYLKIKTETEKKFALNSYALANWRTSKNIERKHNKSLEK